MKRIFKAVKKFLREERGASAMEYLLIVALVMTGLAAAALSLGDAIKDAFHEPFQTAPACEPESGEDDCDARPL